MIIFVSVSVSGHRTERCPFGHSLRPGTKPGRLKAFGRVTQPLNRRWWLISSGSMVDPAADLIWCRPDPANRLRSHGRARPDDQDRS